MISQQELNDLFNRPDIKILEIHKQGPKVLETDQGEIIKVFYKKGAFSSDSTRPYALRFYNNAMALKNLKIKAPEVKEIKYCSKIGAHVVYYNKLPGETVTQLVSHANPDLLKNVILFICHLHQKGVFFRAIHLSNLLYQQNDFALLDIADLQIKEKSLSLYDRYRNLRHFFSNKKDFPLWGTFSLKERLELYLNTTNLSPLKSKILKYFILKKCNQPRA